ncbi:ring-cleaving dioxygenase [Sphaerobacter thermophilus]|mgnify:FL=1|uniref:ring-cleaving dioxygenase n=1 Tax=Sphaerobacter thermophilus TaxID=2057 RepID=UPI0039C2F49A
MNLGGLHHVTAVTSRASENVAFYTEVLGLRLVKKTVNQDDVSAYHLFYGDELGRPGTEMTFFDWERVGAHQEGSGQISNTSFRVPGRAAIEWWAQRLDAYGVQRGEIGERLGRTVLPFQDPEGQRLELMDDMAGEAAPRVEPGIPWDRSPVPAEYGIRGLAEVTLTVRELAPTAFILTEVLGFRQVAADRNGEFQSVTYETGPGGPGALVRVVVRPDLPFRPRSGAGGVHHVAFRTPNDEEHAAWQRRLAQIGIGVTPVIDRYYFKSIYFREPGGVLFEIATDGPGFATDEDPEHLGERLALPPFLEPHRAEIEAGLKPIRPVTFAPPSAGD